MKTIWHYKEISTIYKSKSDETTYKASLESSGPNHGAVEKLAPTLSGDLYACCSHTCHYCQDWPASAMMLVLWHLQLQSHVWLALQSSGLFEGSKIPQPIAYAAMLLTKNFVPFPLEEETAIQPAFAGYHPVSFFLPWPAKMTSCS